MSENSGLDVSRRAFVGSALTAGALAVTEGEVALGATKSAAYRESKRVDVHSHYIPPPYRQALTDAGITTIGGIPVPAWTPELARNFMKDPGIQLQMLSLIYPKPGDPQPALSQSFKTSERRRIDRLNARAEFPRARKSVPGT